MTSLSPESALTLFLERNPNATREEAERAALHAVIEAFMVTYRCKGWEGDWAYQEAERLLSHAAPHATVKNEKREAFEAWANRHRYDLRRCSDESYAAYKSDLTQGAWSGWLGRDE